MSGPDDARNDHVAPFEHARLLVGEEHRWNEEMHEKLRDHIDQRNKHRVDAIVMVNEAIGKHEAALTDKGWVQLGLNAVQDAITGAESALQRSIDRVDAARIADREVADGRHKDMVDTLRWLYRLLIAALLGVVVDVGQQLLAKGHS